MFPEKLRARLAWLLAGPSPMRALATESWLSLLGQEKEGKHFRESGRETQQSQDAVKWLFVCLFVLWVFWPHKTSQMRISDGALLRAQLAKLPLDVFTMASKTSSPQKCIGRAHPRVRH